MKQSTAIWGGVVLVLAVGLVTMLAAGIGPFSAISSAPTVPTVPTDAGEGTVVCESSTTPDLLITAYDTYNVGTAITESSVYREKGTNAWTNFKAGTAITSLKVGTVYEVVAGLNTTDTDDLAYGPHFFTEPIPCSERVTVEIGMYNDEVEASLSSTFYNADGDVGAETFSAGQTQTVSLKIMAGTDEVFGNPTIVEEGGVGNEGQRAAYPNVVCLDLNSSAFDAPEKVTFAGEEMNRVNTPQGHAGSATDIAYCYEAPIFTDSLMEQERYYVRLNADDTNAPAIDDTASIYSADFYIDSNDGIVKFGVEDEDGDLIGAGAADTVTIDVTA